ncbi:hypothetical protein BKI52_22285 [marine bacterium AO1-C]|nr:hypothetical protein BKI52_22285 [marine bacterium AO1-C]
MKTKHYQFFFATLFITFSTCFSAKGQLYWRTDYGVGMAFIASEQANNNLGISGGGLAVPLRLTFSHESWRFGKNLYPAIGLEADLLFAGASDNHYFGLSFELEMPQNEIGGRYDAEFYFRASGGRVIHFLNLSGYGGKPLPRDMVNTSNKPYLNLGMGLRSAFNPNDKLKIGFFIELGAMFNKASYVPAVTENMTHIYVKLGLYLFEGIKSGL